MNKTIAIVGGDYRIIKLAQMLREEQFEIRTYGLEKSNQIKENEKFDNIEICIDSVDKVISAIPFSKNGRDIFMPYSDKILKIEELVSHLKGKKLVAGNIKLECENVEIYDLMKNEPLTVLNAVATAEGAIQIAMEETERTIYKSNILILGFGRIGKILAKNLTALGAKVACEARNESDLEWISAYGYRSLHLKSLEENLSIIQYDIIFNTIPHLILDKEKLKYINKKCLIIDLASKPGGVDLTECDKLGLKCKWALALPGKVAPITSAEKIKSYILKI